MWDLQQIIANNNLAAINAMMQGNKVANVENPLPDVWPLSFLAGKLKVGPPVLSEIMRGFVDIDTITSFLRLIRDYLPEYEDEILSQSRSQRVYKFCYLFNQKYYPLPSGSAQNTMMDFVEKMPIELLGMSYDAYHELNFRPGYLLLLSLVVYPYEGDERDQVDDDVPFDPVNTDAISKPGWQPRRSDVDWVKNLITTLADGGEWIAPMGFTITKIDNLHIEVSQAVNDEAVKEAVQMTVLIAQKLGIQVKVKVGHTAEEKNVSGARVPLLEAVKTQVGAELVGMIPDNGWDAKSLHDATDGTQYEGVGHFADWVCAKTGSIVLDSNYEHCAWVIEGSTEPNFQWSKYNVKRLTKEWPNTQKYREKIDHIVSWVEDNPPVNFQELLKFLIPKLTGVETKPVVYDPFDHYIKLDQEDEETKDDYVLAGD